MMQLLNKDKQLFDMTKIISNIFFQYYLYC